MNTKQTISRVYKNGRGKTYPFSSTRQHERGARQLGRIIENQTRRETFLARIEASWTAWRARVAASKTAAA